MKEYDVIVVGGGPAGGQCARALAYNNRKVLLVERSSDFSVNSYSSAGAPEELMQMFSLPESVVGSDWNKILIHSANKKHFWEKSDGRRGVVMDFQKLRTFLADEAKMSGGELRLGLSCQGYDNQSDGSIIATFKSHDSKAAERMKTKVLVDATGCERQVLAKKINFKGNSFPSTGIEYLIEVSPEVYQRWAKTLSFFMGTKWMPQGYSWIFPMEPNKLKVGVGRYFQNREYVPYNKSYAYYLNAMMKNCLGSTNFPIVDKHGKTLVYTYGRKDPHYDGNAIAIGDAVSTVNPLAYEGIRHAMLSGRLAAKYILKKLDGQPNAFKHYTYELNRQFRWKWKLCEMLMHLIYKEPDDANIDLMVEAYSGLAFDEMMDLGFHYKLYPAMKFLARYTLLRAKGKVVRTQ